MRLVTPFGLIGEYFDNPFLQDQPVIRVDAVINFTWGVGAVTEWARLRFNVGMGKFQHMLVTVLTKVLRSTDFCFGG